MNKRQQTWLKGGIIAVGNYDRNLMFARRLGEATTDLERIYERELSEDVVRKLAEMGTNLLMSYFYKGFGFEAEKKQMQHAKQLAALCHKYRIKHCCYIQFHSLMYETFFQEQPDAKNWIQVDQYGRPVNMAYGHGTWRYKPCFNHRECVDYLKRIVRYAIEEVKTDMIHFDNFRLSPEPDSCHCEVCKRKFLSFLKTKYPSNKIREQRFGFTNLDNILPPTYSIWCTPFTLEKINDPVRQEWIDFRCQSLAEVYRELADYIRKLNPTVVVECNPGPGGVDGENSAFLRGIDYPRICSHGDVFWSEEPNQAMLTQDGNLVSKIRTFKAGRTLENVVLSYTGKFDFKFIDGVFKWYRRSAEEIELSMAESLSFNGGTLGKIGGFLEAETLEGVVSLQPERKKYIEFHKKYQHYYEDTTGIAEVAVLRSYASLAYDCFAPHLSVILFEQSLIQRQMLFDIIFDNELHNLSKYSVLVLPNVECLSTEQMEIIRDFVANGGGLVATEDTSLYDQWRRRRPNFGLADLFHAENLDLDYVKGDLLAKPSLEKCQVEYKEGRVVYIPKIKPSQPEKLPKEEGRLYRIIDNRYWKLPLNSEELIDAVEWTSGKGLSIKVRAPRTLAIEGFRQSHPTRSIIHLVNYDTCHDARDIQIMVRLSPHQRILKVYSTSPEKVDMESIDYHLEGDMTCFAIPRVQIYALVVMELGSEFK